MNHAQKRARIKTYIDQVWNAHDPDALDALVTPDFRRHLGPAQEPIDAAGQKARISMFQKAFPDLRLDIADLLVDGDRGVFRVIVRGTHEAELLGVARTGAQIAVESVDIVRLQGDKIAEIWGVVDLLGLVQQLKAATK